MLTKQWFDACREFIWVLVTDENNNPFQSWPKPMHGSVQEEQIGLSIEPTDGLQITEHIYQKKILHFSKDAALSTPTNSIIQRW